MNAREKAHAELQHALDALTDGAGDNRLWGPGVILFALDKRAVKAPDAGIAADAFSDAAALAWRIVLPDVGTARAMVAPERQALYEAAMRKLAPVILDIRLDALGVE